MRRPATAAALFLGAVAIAATGGPDTEGYTWLDSNESPGPGHAVLDIDGTDLGLVDEDTGLVELPFDFHWYGNTETSLVVSDNGTAFFQGDAGGPWAECPTTNQVWSGIAAYWDDLTTDTVSVATLGRYPNRMVVVDWEGMHPDGIPGEGHVQTWLMEGTREVAIVLDDVEFEDTGYDGGAGAIVGVQGISGVGLAVSCAGGLSSGTTFWVSPPYGRADNSDIDLTSAEVHLTGANDYDQFGESLATGDVNGDGHIDLLAGTSTQDTAWLVYGGPHISSATTDAMGLPVQGGSGTYLGQTVAVGDLSGDGFAEMVIGAPRADFAANEAGSVWIVSTLAAGGSSAIQDHAAARLDGPAASTKARAGTALAIPGDVDGDGYDDLLVGAPREDTRGADAGAAYLWYGSSNLGGVTDLSVAPRFQGEALNDRLGDAVAGGDIDGDGAAELFLGAPQNDTSAIDGGRAYVLPSGSWSGAHFVETASTLFISGSGPLDKLGSSLLVADLSGDGIGELLAAAPDNDLGGTGAGSLFVFEQAHLLSGAVADTDADVEIRGSGPYQKIGTSLDTVDLDQDGGLDLLIGSPGASSGTPSGGAVWVFKSLPAIALADVTMADHVLSGTLPGGAAGTAIAGWADRRGDGYGGVAVGVPFASAGGNTNNGAVSVWTYAPAWLDADGDGLLAQSTRGPDCDDDDATVFPGATEDTGLDSDGFADDGDCDGWVDGAFSVRNRQDWWEYDVTSHTNRSATEFFDFEAATLGASVENLYADDDLLLTTGGQVLATTDVYGSLPFSTLAAEVIPANRNKLTFEFAAGVDALAFRLFDSESPLSLSATDASGAELLPAPARIFHPGDDVPGGRFVGITFSPTVHSVSISGPTNDGYGVDDLLIAWAAESDKDADGVSESEGDCDDTSDAISPNATEVWYDGVDQDCDGGSDFDADGDGHDSNEFGGTDCDDADGSIYPGAIETDPLDGIDENCDGDAEWDDDGDGYNGAVWGGNDCDDANTAIHPGATEICYDGVDQDCSGTSDNDCDGDGVDDIGHGGWDCDDSDATIAPGARDHWYDGIDSDCGGDSDFDADRDGFDADWYGGTDCDDTDPLVAPGATDTWYDGVDSNCDSASDFDADGDGEESDAHGGDDCDDTNATILPGATEVPYDGIDQDCDGCPWGRRL